MKWMPNIVKRCPKEEKNRPPTTAGANTTQTVSATLFVRLSPKMLKMRVLTVAGALMTKMVIATFIVRAALKRYEKLFLS